MSSLFRQEAVSHATRRLTGEVVLATPVSFRVTAALAVIFVIGAVLFVATASYARKETVVGWLTPDAGLIRLAARQGGVVEAIHVKEGDIVSVGQPVATLRLLSGTIADNIAFFDPDLDMARVQEAAVAARIHDDIGRMPMQYLSLVGDMGSTLSGGQKQRVLLARALYRQPRVLILDEGTANLDVETEELIGELIGALPITRIVVAHRPALLRRADRVVMLQGGALVDAQVPNTRAVA